LFRIVLCVAVVVLFFSGDENPSGKITWREKYLQQDSLASYITKLFELTDDNPFYYSHKADSLLTTLWRQPKTVDEQITYLDFLLNTAYHLLQQGQIPASCRWYEKGLNYQQACKLPYETEEYIYKPLGNNYVRLGDYDKAIAMQEIAVGGAIQNKKNELLASLFSNLAISYFWLKNYDAVQTNCNSGLQFIAFNTSVKGLLYNVKSDAFFETGQLDSAAWYNQKALQFFLSPESVGADPGWTVSTLQLSAKLLSKQKNYSAALVKLTNAERILNQSFPETRQRDKAKLLAEKGNLFLKMNNADSARVALVKAIQYFPVNEKGFFPDHTVSSLYFGLAQSFEQTDADNSLNYYQLAVENDYYASQLIVSSYNSLSGPGKNEEMNQKAVYAFEKQFEQTRDSSYIKKILWLTELSKGRKLLNEVKRSNEWQQDSSANETRQLFAELRYDYLLLAEEKDSVKRQNIQQRIRAQELKFGLHEERFSHLLQEPSFEKFANMLNQLRQQSTVISYYETGDSLVSVKVSGNSISYHKMPLSLMKDEVNRFVNNYFTDGSSSFSNDPGKYFITANQLYAKLFSDTDKESNKLIISPDGCMYLLPFEALVTREQQFLGEQKEISYNYSLLQYLNDGKEKKTALRVQVFTFTQNHLGFSALPASLTEAKLIENNFSSSVTGAEKISGDEFLQTIHSPSVLHIATHAVADDSLNQPYLVVKNKLYLGQLQYTITSSPLVVLTACESAAGNLQKGEGVASLARAFISKGVKGVVASRWKVDDAVAPLLVKEFYAQLKKKHSPSSALFAARKQYLQTAENLSAKNPLLWAGFSYMGVEQEVELQTAGSLNWWWLLLLLVPVAYVVNKKRS
jgi:CHAT domain-containing protein